MAIPPSAGNPVIVGPYKRIVGVNWGVTPPRPTRYIITSGTVNSLSDTTFGEPTIPWDGVTGSPPGSWPYYQEWSITQTIWQETLGYYGNSFYFTSAQILDSSGTVLFDDDAATLGVTITKPPMPNTQTYSLWQYASVSNNVYASPMTMPVVNPCGEFYSDAGIGYNIATPFLPDPAPQYYYYGVDGDGNPIMAKYGHVGIGTSVYMGPVDLRDVTATYDGDTFAPVGYRHYESERMFSVGDNYTIVVLLKSVGTVP